MHRDAVLVSQLLHGRNRLARAKAVLSAIGSLHELCQCSEVELARVPGVGVSGAASLAASVELARRWMTDTAERRTHLRDPAAVATLVRATLLGASQEHFLAIGVTARQRVCMVHEAARGSVSHVDVHPREVFRRAVREGVYAVILAHNHPSGDPSPSEADVHLTLRMVDAGRMLGIPVLDHVVVASGGFVSMAATGLMEPNTNANANAARHADTTEDERSKPRMSGHRRG